MDCYKPFALLRGLFFRLRVRDVTGRAAKTATDAHGDAAAIDEVAGQIGDDDEYSYDD